MKMKLIRIRTTGREYAIPMTRYSDLPCVRVVDGMPLQTAFSYEELRYMVNHNLADVVGEAEITFKITRNEDEAQLSDQGA